MGCACSKQFDANESSRPTHSKTQSSSFNRIHSSLLGSFPFRSRRSNDSHNKSATSMERQVEKMGYPSPDPPTNCKAALFQKERFSDVDQHVSTVPISMMYGTFKEITKYLTKPFKTDLEKVRALFVWVTSLNMNLMQSCLCELPAHNTPLEYLLRIHWKLANHAHLFAQLCRTAGIPCVLVTGIIKNAAFYMGGELHRRSMTSHWNGVYCDGNWHFIDVHLSTTLIPNKTPSDWDMVIEEPHCALINPQDCKANDIIKNVNEAYFLIDPDQLIYTHFPDDPNWQLLDNPISQEQFLKNAFIRERFFEIGMQIRQPVTGNNEGTLQAEDAQISIEFSLPEEKADFLQFRYALFKHKKGGPTNVNVTLDRYVLYQKTNNSLKFIIRLPVRSRFKLNVFGQDTQVHDSYELCASYLIECSGIKKLHEPFPACPDIGWAPGHETTKLGMIAKTHEEPIIDSADGKIDIRFSLENPMSLVLSLTHNIYIPLVLKHNIKARIEHGVLYITIRLQKKGEYALSLYMMSPSESGDLPNVCNYLVRCLRDNNMKSFPRIHESVLGAGYHADRLNVHALNKVQCKFKTNTGSVTVEFESDANISVDILCELHNADVSKSILSESVTVNSCGQNHKLELNLPQKGEYAFNVYAREHEDEDCRLFHIHTYLIESTQTTSTGNVSAATDDDDADDVAIVPYFVTGDTAVIRVATTASGKPRVAELLRKNAMRDELTHQVTHRRVRDNDVFRINLPHYGEYKFDVFALNDTCMLSHVAQFQITRHEPQPGEEEDVVEEGFEELTEQERQRRVEEKTLEAKHLKYRRNLRLAMTHRDTTQLRHALREFEALNIPEEKHDLTKARLLLDFLLVDKDMTEALQLRLLDDLEYAMASAEAANLTIKLGLKMLMAHKVREQLRRLDKIRRDSLGMDNQFIYDIGNISKPHDVIVNVMKATFIMLGIPDKNIKNWSAIQALLQPNSKKNIKRQIAQFTLDHLTMENAFKAKHCLKTYTLNEVRNADKACAVFYVWTRGMIDEANARSTHQKLDAWGGSTEVPRSMSSRTTNSEKTSRNYSRSKM